VFFNVVLLELFMVVVFPLFDLSASCAFKKADARPAETLQSSGQVVGFLDELGTHTCQVPVA
jgi:hypothetical protein